MIIAMTTLAPVSPAPGAPAMTVDWARLGRHLQAYRANARVTREALAQSCGVTASDVARAERGAPLGPAALVLICAKLGRAPAFFCTTAAGWQPHPDPDASDTGV